MLQKWAEQRGPEGGQGETKGGQFLIWGSIPRGAIYQWTGQLNREKRNETKQTVVFRRIISEIKVGNNVCVNKLKSGTFRQDLFRKSRLVKREINIVRSSFGTLMKPDFHYFLFLIRLGSGLSVLGSNWLQGRNGSQTCCGSANGHKPQQLHSIFHWRTLSWSWTRQ